MLYLIIAWLQPRKDMVENWAVHCRSKGGYSAIRRGAWIRSEFRGGERGVDVAHGLDRVEKLPKGDVGFHSHLLLPLLLPPSIHPP